MTTPTPGPFFAVDLDDEEWCLSFATVQEAKDAALTRAAESCDFDEAGHKIITGERPDTFLVESDTDGESEVLANLHWAEVDQVWSLGEDREALVVVGTREALTAYLAVFEIPLPPALR